MKDKNIVIVIIAMICIIVLSLLYLFYNKPLNTNIKNITWYKYDIKTGVYDQIEINEDSIVYKVNNEGTKGFNGCSKYRYNSKSKTISLDCGEKIYIKNVTEDSLLLSINGEETKFFQDIEDTLNYEFMSFYGQSRVEYKEEKSQIEQLLKISPNKIAEVVKSKEKNIIVFVGDNCANLDCTLFLGVLEKWNVDNSNLFFVDSDTLTLKVTRELNIINNMFSTNIDIYNDSYPLVYIVENKKVINTFKFKCNGFDCTMWKDIAKNAK